MTKLVVLCDGTWNTPTQSRDGTPCPTNVTKLGLALAAKDDEGVEQRQDYRPGVGNRAWERLRGGALGWGLSREVREAYRWVVEQYQPGDELYFVGFSRGAYTVRSTVGLVRKAGLLRPEHAGRVDRAYDFYRDRKVKPADPEAVAFRRRWSRPETSIRFIGVWDTVGALGIPWTGNKVADLVNRPWSFHDTELSSHVENAFQALAVDERRRPFTPAVWSQQEHAVGQRLEQVWFAGDHCDVGGGHPESDLSDVSLRWMIRRAQECGLAFDPPDAVVASARDAVGATRWNGVVAPAALGRIHASVPLPYRLARQVEDRRIGTTHRGHEYVSDTALDRWQGLPSYRPGSLRRYLDTTEEGRRRVMPIDLTP